MDKKQFQIILGIQVVLLILIVFSFNQINTKLKKISGEKGGASDTAAINSLSARLGQVQVDLNMIKSKLGATTPAPQKK